MKEELSDYFKLLPESIRPLAFCAGGAAVDLERAHDVDFFILLSEDTAAEFKPDSFEDVFSSILNAVLDYASKHRDQIGEVLAKSISESYGDDRQRLLICEITPVNLHKRIHVCLGLTDSVFNLLAAFDTSVHAFAIGNDGLFYATPQTTTPGAPIDVFRYDTPIGTLKRYIRLCERYGQPVDDSIIETLVIGAAEVYMDGKRAKAAEIPF